MNWVWWAWFGLWAGGAIVAFAILEARAFKYPDRQNTLSRSVATLGAKWPLSIFISGFLLGALIFGLAVHFYWHWCPDLMPPGHGG